MEQELKTESESGKIISRATMAVAGSILFWCWRGVCFRKRREMLVDMAARRMHDTHIKIDQKIMLRSIER